MLTVMVAMLIAQGQAIPARITYVRADPRVNSLAERKLQAIFGKDPTTADYGPVSGSTVVIGPALWQDMEDAVETSFDSAKEVTFKVPTSEGLREFKGKATKGAEQMELTWIALSIIAKKSGKAKIRRATAEELDKYWTMISWDIEEPVFVVDCGKAKILVDFVIQGGDPKPFFVDLISGYDTR